ncbi:MAG: DUF1501 domain-containing protein [Myxococcota bacterium]
MNRRNFLYGASAALAAMGVALPSRAVGVNDRKLIFVFAPGGWDPTRVFAPEFANPNVSMEARAERASKGGLAWVSHPDRPSVDLFFDNQHQRSLVVNGMMVRSIAHEICTMITMTGTSSGLAPDWPAIVANQDRVAYTLPHLVISGPSFPGDLGVAVARTGVNGQLEALVSGEVEQWSAVPVQSPDRVDEDLIDRYLARRAGARAEGSRSEVEARLTAAFRDSTSKVGELKDLRYTMDFQASILLEDQARVAVDALKNGVSRCVTIAYAGAQGQGWDTHAQNDDAQSPLWEGLFAGLLRLTALLEGTPGHSGATLADETMVVVLSEMARTPALNGLLGKDHWPYTSAMLVGPNLTGDRVVGGFDDAYYGKLVDPATAEVSETGEVLSAESLGATLLTWAGIDPAEHVSGVAPLDGVLA